jgi:hypothetical protein
LELYVQRTAPSSRAQQQRQGTCHIRTAVPDQPASEAQKYYKTLEKHIAGSATHNRRLQRKADL